MAALQLKRSLSRALFSIAASPLSHNNNNRTLTTLTRFTSNMLSSPDCRAAAADLQSCPWSALQRRGIKLHGSYLKLGNVIEKSDESIFLPSLYIRWTGRIYQVVEAEHEQPGRGGAMMTLKLRDVDVGSKQSLQLGTEECIERVFVEEQSFTFLYTDNNTAHLMDPVTFEQLEVPLDLFGKAAPYLKERMEVKLHLHDGTPLSGSVPKHVTCTIIEIRTSDAHWYKKAVLDNDLTILVPACIERGDKVIVNTGNNSYIGRIKTA